MLEQHSFGKAALPGIFSRDLLHPTDCYSGSHCPGPRPQAHQAARASRRPHAGQQVAPGLHGRSRAVRLAPREVASERGRCASAAATPGPGANVASGARQGLERARAALRSCPHCFRPVTLPRAVRADYARVPVTGGRACGRRLRLSRRPGRGRVGTRARFPPRRAEIGRGRGWRQVAGTWGPGPRVACDGEAAPTALRASSGYDDQPHDRPALAPAEPIPRRGSAGRSGRPRLHGPRPPPAPAPAGTDPGSGRGDARTPRWRRPNNCSAPGEPQLINGINKAFQRLPRLNSGSSPALPPFRL
ncbi:serine/arginine repetitive matrix protein 3-like [Nomascus leucogenys]|uniref:serine/arginine repetitive matrix protein 3-like n=1 Tax=Nomascus leucogenys TaxID=61853 RepID=UPI00122D98B7|nr:serine/arginine repetitive matrix protein 3-like [Nomascus leucogenys]